MENVLIQPIITCELKFLLNYPVTALFLATLPDPDLVKRMTFEVTRDEESDHFNLYLKRGLVNYG